LDEAEYVAASMATTEALWLRELLSEMGVDGDAEPLGEDNQACLALGSTLVATGRTKHFDVAYHMVRDYVARGEVSFYILPSADMPVNGMTKPLPAPALTAFRGSIGVGWVLGTSRTRGMRALRPAPQCWTAVGGGVAVSAARHGFGSMWRFAAKSGAGLYQYSPPWKQALA